MPLMQCKASAIIYIALNRLDSCTQTDWKAIRSYNKYLMTTCKLSQRIYLFPFPRKELLFSLNRTEKLNTQYHGKPGSLGDTYGIFQPGFPHFQRLIEGNIIITVRLAILEPWGTSGYTNNGRVSLQRPGRFRSEPLHLTPSLPFWVRVRLTIGRGLFSRSSAGVTQYSRITTQIPIISS